MTNDKDADHVFPNIPPRDAPLRVRIAARLRQLGLDIVASVFDALIP